MPSQEDGIVDSSVFLRDGSPRTVRIGDRLSSSIQSDMSFTVPTLTLAVDTAADTAAGSCLAGKRLMLLVLHNHSQQFAGFMTCTAGGTFGFDTSGSYDIVAGDRVEITLRFAKGDLVARRAVAS